MERGEELQNSQDVHLTGRRLLLELLRLFQPHLGGREAQMFSCGQGCIDTVQRYPLSGAWRGFEMRHGAGTLERGLWTLIFVCDGRHGRPVVDWKSTARSKKEPAWRFHQSRSVADHVRFEQHPDTQVVRLSRRRAQYGPPTCNALFGPSGRTLARKYQSSH